MKKNFTFIVFLFVIFNSPVLSNELGCDQFKKFSLDFMKCKANTVKNKTLSAGKSFVEDTKNFQDKEWTEEKKKIDKIKKKVLEK